YTPPPLVVGSNHDEGRIFSSMLTIDTEAQYTDLVGMFAGSYASAILAIYPASAYPTPKDAFDAVLRDLGFTCPARTLVRLASVGQRPVWRYEFQQDTTAPLGLGATHGAELPYVFGNFPVPFTHGGAADRALTTTIQGYWTRHAATGDPNGGGAPA